MCVRSGVGVWTWCCFGYIRAWFFSTFSLQSSFSLGVSCSCFKVICSIPGAFLYSLLPPHVSVSLLTVFGCGPVWILNSLLCPLAIRFDFVWFGFVRNRERERQRVIVCCRLYVSDWPFKNSQRDCERTWHLNICEPIHYCLCSVFCFHYQYLHKPSYSTINTLSAKKYSCFCRDCWLIYEAQVITYLIAEAL